MPYVPYIMYGLLLATLLATLLLAYDLARKSEVIPLLGGRKPEDAPAELFLGMNGRITSAPAGLTARMWP